MRTLKQAVSVLILGTLLAGCALMRPAQEEPALDEVAMVPSKVTLDWDYVPDKWENKQLVGYRLYRRPANHGQFTPVTNAPLEPEAVVSQASGHPVQHYRFDDFAVVNGHVYEYQKEAVYSDGSTDREPVGIPKRAEPLTPEPGRPVLNDAMVAVAPMPGQL